MQKHKVLRLPGVDPLLKHKTHARPPSLSVGIAKKSVSCETSSTFHTLKQKNRQFRTSFSYKAIFTKLKNVCFLRRIRQFSSTSQNAVPATTFDTVSCFRSPDTAIHQNSNCATSQNAAPATRKRHGNIDRLPKYCACHAKRKRHPNACHKTPQNHAIGEEIHIQQMILSKFCERRPTAEN